MKISNVLLIVICAVLVTSCAAQSTRTSTQIVKEKKRVSTFQKISSSGGIDIYFTQTNNCSLEIETNAENMSKIDISVKNGCLQLQRKKNEKFAHNTKIKAYVSAPVLDAIATSGGVDFYSKSISNSNNLNIASSGGADIYIDKLDVVNFNLAISGGSDAYLKQMSARNINIAASGGSDANVSISNADVVAISASGGADVKLSGKVKMVSAKASGGSDIDVKGLTYEHIDAAKSGGGNILR